MKTTDMKWPNSAITAQAECTVCDVSTILDWSLMTYFKKLF